jgi:virulence-associated protein VapD
MAVQKRFKAINFDLDTKKLKEAFGENRYRRGYSLIQRFMTKNGFVHHQYSGYISKSAMSYGDIYILVLDTMLTAHAWMIDCVNKFDATNVTSQSDMLNAIQNKTEVSAVNIPSELEGDDEVTL